jgi:hypothetical protein
MSNSKTVLLVRTRLPWPDDTTQISCRWAEAVRQSFEANGWRVIDLGIDDAVRANVEKLLEAAQSSVFLFYGHGKPDRMIGQDKNALIDLDNCHILKKQKVYVVACWTAEVLGRESADIARCYLGYEREIFVGSEAYVAYLEKCVNKGILAMLDTPCCTIERARQHIIEEYDYWIEYFTVGAGASTLSVFFAVALLHNHGALAQVFGDRTATLTD